MAFYQFLKKTQKEAPRRFFILLFAVSFAFWGGIIVLASPPDNPYAPGATLDPDCIPGSANCTVYPPLATGLTATTTVTMSDYPLNFDSGTFYIDSLNNRIGIGTTSPATALDMANGVITLGNTANPLIQQYDNGAWGTNTKKLTIQGGATSASDIITFDAKGIEGEPVYQNYQDIILAESSLVSYWKMDNNWTDSKGANDGTAQGGVSFDVPKYGSNAGNFDGVSGSYIDCGADTSLEIPGVAITVEAWVKTSVMPMGQGIVSKDMGSGWNPGYGLYFLEDNKVYFGINEMWETDSEAGAPFAADGEWHHIVGTYDGSFIRIFVDGVEGAPVAYTEEIRYATNEQNRGFAIGAVNNSWWSVYMGLVDEVAVYDTALSAETIINHYNSVASNSFRTKIHFVNTGTTYVDLYQDGDIYAGAGNTKLKLTPSVTNGATAVAYTFDTENTLSTAGAKLLSVKNNGTEKVYINKDGGAYFAGNVGIGTSTPYAKLSVWGGGTGTGQAFEIANSASTTLASILDNGTAYFAGNVGIGTTTPNNTIQVKDLINFDNAKSGTFLGHLAGNSNTGGLNTFVGYQAGKSNTAGFENTAIGWQALMTNTSAGENTAVGANALASNVSGVDNTAVGVLTLQDNISGDENTAVGIQSLQTNTTGYNNTSMGAYSLYHNTTGYDNIAIGINAGRFIADGVSHNHTSNTSVYLGAATKALTDSDTNEIVIGYNAIGLGSNSAILGNDSITKTVLNGNVGIGTTTPYAKLSVVGETVSSYFTATSTTATSTFPYLSITNNSNLGTVVGGTWRGTAIADTYISSATTWNNKWDLASTTIGVAYGGTGATTLTGLLQGNGTGAITGITGTAGQFPYYNGTSALTATSSIFLAASGNVGIGTTSPGALLDVNGSPAFRNYGKFYSGTTLSGYVGNANNLFTPGGAGELGVISIGNLYLGNNNSLTPVMTLNNDNIGIGTTTPWRKLSVAGTAGFSGLTNDSTGYYLCLNTTTYEMATSTTACGASSLRFKENVQPMTYGLSEILQLNPVFYDWKDTYMPSENKRQIGLIAEEVSSIIPELAGYDSDGSPINVDYPKATAVIIKAIQELNEKISNSQLSISNQFSIESVFNSILDWLGDKVVRAKEFVASKITVDKVIVKQGFEIEDALTGEVYCVRIYNGEWEKFKGTCGEISSEISTNDQLPIPNDQSNPNIQNTSEETEQVEPVVEPVAEPPLESAEADLTGQAVVEEPVPEPIVEPVIEEPMSTD